MLFIDSQKCRRYLICICSGRANTKEISSALQLRTNFQNEVAVYVIGLLIGNNSIQVEFFLDPEYSRNVQEWAARTACLST